MERLASWSTRWAENKTGWHLDDVNFALRNHSSLLLPSAQRRVLVPLCGKSLDLKWFYDAGHNVVGIEGVEKPVVEFYKEHNIPYVIEPFPGGKLYKSKDGRLHIYCCDLFTLDAATLGKFDSVWDRGSLIAIYEEDTDRYVKLMKSVLAEDFCYLANIVEYEPTETFKGPPRNVPVERVQQLYGDICRVKVLEMIDRSGDEKVKTVFGLDEMSEFVVMLTPNKHN